MVSLKKKKIELIWKGKVLTDESLQIDLWKKNYKFTKNLKRSIGLTDAIFEFFEGDNLTVLKYLYSMKKGQFSFIFADPPYNSHKDFFINDIPGNKAPFWKNQISHEKWLQMIHPRLKLVHHLLNEQKGVLGITIDDKEFSYLRLILDEIFGEKNFIGIVIWRSLHGVKSNAFFTNNHTYLMLYAKNLTNLKKSGFFKIPYESIWTDLSSSIDAREEITKFLSPCCSLENIRYLNPKPLDFLERILALFDFQNEDEILDIFAGTGSLAIASYIKNNILQKEKSTNIRYTGIQFPENIEVLNSNQNGVEISNLSVNIFELALIRIKKFLESKNWEKYFGLNVFELEKIN